MNATTAGQQPHGGLVAIAVKYCGYAFIVLGLFTAANYLFDLEINFKGWGVPDDWKMALLGIIGGVCVALWGHILDTRGYRDLVSRKRWIPWVAWTAVVLLVLASLFVVFMF
jgi:hypothetical protein